MVSAHTLSRIVQSLGGLGMLTLAVAALVTLDAAVLHAPPMLLRLAAGVVGVVLVAAMLRALATALGLVRRERALRRRLRGAEMRLLDGRQVAVVRDERLVACCLGWWTPRVVVSTGALAALPPEQLRAVIAHEDAHAAHRDPARFLASAVVTEALSFLPGARRLGRRYAELLEMAADQRAVREAGRGPLASALVTFSERAVGDRVGPTTGRIEGLLGEPVRIGDTRLLVDGAVLAGLGAVAGWLTSATGCMDLVGDGRLCGGESAAPAVGLVIGVAAVVVACATALRRPGPGRYS